MSGHGPIISLLEQVGLTLRQLTAADLALLLFTATNSVRVFAYLPQIRSVARDRNGASAVSLATWGMFTVSHLSTMAYGLLVVSDAKMAAIFGVNALCSIVIVALTLHKRAQGPARLTGIEEWRLRSAGLARG